MQVDWISILREEVEKAGSIQAVADQIDLGTIASQNGLEQLHGPLLGLHQQITQFYEVGAKLPGRRTG